MAFRNGQLVNNNGEYVFPQQQQQPTPNSSNNSLGLIKTNTTTTNPIVSSAEVKQVGWHQDANGQWTTNAPNVDANSWAGDRLNDLNAAADKYADDLRATAKGDYDFAIKWLTKQHQTALGTDDVERAKFFETVANSLEKKIGRIPYDYLTKTDREKQDIANYMLDQNRAQEDQFQRDYEFKQQQTFNKQQQTEQRQEGFNARGLGNSGLELKQKQTQDTQRQLFETDPQARMMAYETDSRNAAIRNRQLQSTRTLQDLTTNARRTGLDTQQGFEQGTEQSNRTLAQRLAEISSQQELLKRQNVAQVGTELGNIYG